MGLRIGTNLASINAQRNLARSEHQAIRASRALSSGSRITQPGDDAAGWAISENLRGQAVSLQSAKQNAENAKGFIQVAEGGLNEQNNILIRLRELAIQSASDTVGESERSYLNTEFESLVTELDRIAETTTYGAKKLLTGTNQQYEFYLGAGNSTSDVITYKLEADTRAQTLELSDVTINEKSDARKSLASIDKALTMVSKARAGFGAVQSRFSIASSNLDIQRENILDARSRMADADIAAEVSNLAQAKVMQEAGIAVLAQANMNPERAQRLLR